MASEILSRIRRPFRYSFKNATLSIIAINAVVYFLFNFTNLIPVGEDYFSINVVGFVFHQCFWQPLTYMFMHGNIQHLFFNMLGLLFFGMQVERALGSKEFVMMYLVIGVLSGLFSVGVYYALGAYMVSQGMYPYTYLVSLVGASGANIRNSSRVCRDFPALEDFRVVRHSRSGPDSRNRVRRNRIREPVYRRLECRASDAPCGIRVRVPLHAREDGREPDSRVA